MTALQPHTQIMSKPENRGIHWRAKVRDGHAPTPWKSNTKWADIRKNMQNTLYTTAQEVGVQVIMLPWESVAECKVGNSNKTLWMYLMICKWKGVVLLRESDHLRIGFLGIIEVCVPHDKVEEFNKGPFSVSSNGNKTAKKQWRIAGFVEHCSPDSVVLRFDGNTRDHMRVQQNRGSGRKVRAIHTVVPANPSALESLKAFFPKLIPLLLPSDFKIPC